MLTRNSSIPTLIGFVRKATVVLVVILCGACHATYSVPGASADFRALGISDQQADALTDDSIRQRLDRVPLAKFPAVVAVARLQGQSYCSYTARGYGEGKYTLVTTRDVESPEAFDRLSTQPMLAGVAPLNRLVVPERINSERDLRNAAAQVQADMLLIYTFDTVFGTDTKVAPLGLLTLGLFPDREARVTSTASAALIDTRNGYVYGLAEATGEEKQLTNAWTNENAVDSSRRKAEREAFEGLLPQIEALWKGVASRFGPANATAINNKQSG